MNNLTIDQFRVARETAQREIDTAVTLAMKKFNETTGEHITDVTIVILEHRDSSRRVRVVNDSRIHGVTVRTTIE